MILWRVVPLLKLKDSLLHIKHTQFQEAIFVGFFFLQIVEFSESQWNHTKRARSECIYFHQK